MLSIFNITLPFACLIINILYEILLIFKDIYDDH